MKSLIVIIYVSFACHLLAYTQKNDTIYLLNGDRITGEFKKVESALVYLKTDAMKTVNIEVEKVNTAYSAKNFEFRTTSGYRYFGSIRQAPSQGSITLITREDTIVKPLWDIVQISQIQRRFFQRIDGSIDVGLNYTKSIDVFQYNLNGWVTYRSTNVSTRVDLTSILSQSGDDELARNNDLGVNVTRYFPNKWFTRVQVDGQENTELNLDHRFQFGPAVGYDLIRTSPVRLYTLVGLLANTEKTLDTKEETVNLEGLVSVYYSWLRYRHPKVDISSGVDFYPSISNAGRVRAEFDASIKYEILTDVFFNLSFYYNFDSEPDSGGSSSADYGIVTSFGYTF